MLVGAGCVSRPRLCLDSVSGDCRRVETSRSTFTCLFQETTTTISSHFPSSFCEHSGFCVTGPPAVSPRLLSLAVSEAGTDHVVSFVFMSSELTGKELSEESETPCARSEVARQAVPAETLAGAAIPSPPPCLGDIRVVAVTWGTGH